MQFGYGVPSQIYLRILRLPPPKKAPSLFCWDLRVICIDWIPCLHAVNCETRYAVFLHHIPTEVEELHRLVLEEIRLQMTQDGFSEALIDAYFSAAGGITATGLHGDYRPAESSHLIELLSWREEPFEEESFGQPFVRQSLNHWRCPDAEEASGEACPDRRLIEAVKKQMQR